MLDLVTNTILVVENALWGFLCVPAIILVGCILTYQSGFAQIRHLPAAVKSFLSFFKASSGDVKGVSPLKTFFAGIGGSVGVGNVVGVVTAVQIGGPGALFWIWVTAIAGAILKYSEVYLGMRYRVNSADGGYSGGPMYYLRNAFKKPWISSVVCVLLCLYGVEIFQFSVVTGSISKNLDINLSVVVLIFLGLVMFAGSGGVKRVGSISSALIPIFVALYAGMGFWVLFSNASAIPSIFANVFHSAFNGHAAMGAFVGSSLLATVSHGVRRGCYCGDIGIGYASVIHSESSATIPEKQASLVIFEIFMDTFIICTTSVLIVLATDVWQEPLEGPMLVQTALGQYFPYMHFFMPLFLFLVGYATINAYFCVGLKCAEFLSPKRGRLLYQIYAVVVLISFSFLSSLVAQSVMAIAGGLLLLVNCLGIYLLRKEISFDFSFADEKEPTEAITKKMPQIKITG